MKPARGPRSQTFQNRLLVIDETKPFPENARVGDLARFLNPGDLLVVNDAATLPASFFARTERGEKLEIRLVSRQGGTRFLVVLFGEGDWRTRTEDRTLPPAVEIGSRLQLDRSGSTATVRAFSALSRRAVELEFNLDEAGMWRELYRVGHPIQYSHLRGELDLWDVQTGFAARPWAMEMPSAGKPLTWEVLIQLLRKGVTIVPLTHAAGISSSGDAAFDAMLPLPEQYEIPPSTICAINRTRLQGGRVIAVGTSVTRALEGNYFSHGEQTAGAGVTDLILEPGFERKVVDGILSGMHDATESHYRLLGCFLPREVLESALQEAETRQYLSHEFGDSCLILPKPRIAQVYPRLEKVA